MSSEQLLPTDKSHQLTTCFCGGPSVSGIRHAENMAAHTPSGLWVTTDLTGTLARDKCSLFVSSAETRKSFISSLMHE